MHSLQPAGLLAHPRRKTVNTTQSVRGGRGPTHVSPTSLRQAFLRAYQYSLREGVLERRETKKEIGIEVECRGEESENCWIDSRLRRTNGGSYAFANQRVRERCEDLSGVHYVMEIQI
ncbi:hypothetical protein L2E82_11298 [Cichorium intybus]|uniref:Uncharacterized protein n=1 Tax=Cichorium intybus TaxID=13427 RepID=A0ACB9GCP9_CICIN|nr:hypothetical protein L2E82_11298 [Cichorium intybus]